MPAPISDEKRRRFLRLVHQEGYSIAQAQRAVGVSYAWARKANKGFLTAAEFDRVQDAARNTDALEVLARPLRRDELKAPAIRALDDFDLFRRRYLGRVTLPWHIQAAERIVEGIDSEHKEFMVLNAPPGGGKSTLLCDVCLWVTVRNRRIRGVYGSRVYNNAERVTRRMRRYLERTTPVQAKPEDVASGLAVDAEACLALDYGLFRPPTRIDLWRASEFIVAQDDDTPIDEKEPTWSAVGMDTGFLGNRYDLIVWDDLVDNTTIRTVDAIEAQRKWYDDEAESRLEPAGAMFLVGQRFAANDLYRFALDKKVPLDDDDGLDDTEIAELEAEQPSVYGHVKFVAHDDSKCEKDHGRDAPPQPQGCLLDPKRIPWRELNRLRANNPAKYAIQYQQEDANPEQALVKQIWVDGGVDRDTGIDHPGCWDPDRGLAELPTGLVAPFISFATADPSPTRYWGLQWWIYTPQAAQRLWLMDCLRVRMGGNDLLDWIADSQQFTGVMEDWQQRSIAAGFPIRTWIIEVNAAQRFLLQYDHVRRWRSLHNVNVLPHQTTLTKLDPKLGVDMVASWWVNGRIRLPKRGLHAAAASRHLVDEITRYPNAGTDDQVMAHWFAIHHLPRLTPAKDTPTVLRRPAAVLSINDYRGHNVAGRAG